jgi:uncharacterized OsmC-like protein
MPGLQALAPNETRKVRIGEPFRFGMDVIVEPNSQFGKRAFVSSPVPGSAAFEIYCDEGQSVGGGGSAPTPLAYFTAGVALCLMTHITGYLKRTPMNVKKLRIELRGNFWTKLGHIADGGEGEGGCSSFESCVMIDSDEPAARLKDFVKMCEKACIASQTIAAAVPTSVSVVINGERV